MGIFFLDVGSGPPLLLLHGLMITGQMFEPIIEHLAARHRVIVPDLRGHGRSRQLPPPYTAEQHVQDLADLMDRLGITSAAVLGYSHGGAVAQQFVLDQPNRCHRLALACTYACNTATFREKLEGRLMPVLVHLLGMKRFAQFVISLGLKRVTKARADWVKGIMADQDRAAMISAWKEAMAFDSRHRLAEIRCPTLIVAAARDDAVPMHHAEMLHDRIADSQLRVIADADHALIWARPDELLRVLDGFLEERA